MKQLLSIVVPIYFEEELIDEFYGRVKKVALQLEATLDHEILFVNDGSTDRSLELMLELAAKDRCVRVLDLSRNFGHQRAITAGIDHARGDAVVIIDGDLQDPPEVIVRMIEKWREGYQVVYGVRAKRKGESAFKLFTARMFYRTLGKLSDMELPLDAGDFRLMDRAVADVLRGMREESRYIRGLVAWIGFRQTGLPYERDERHAGETKYTLKKMIALAFDGITSFSVKPLMTAVQLGLLITGGSFLGLLYLLINKFLRPETLVSGWTSLLIVILFLGGVQVLSVGILGLYVGRIYREVKGRPLYVIAKRYGFSEEEETDGPRRNAG